LNPIRSMRERISEVEWGLRSDLAACYRLVAKYGMTDLIYNEEVTASSLIMVDLAGNIIEKPDHGYSVNAAGYIIHSAVHEAREDGPVRRPHPTTGGHFGRRDGGRARASSMREARPASVGQRVILTKADGKKTGDPFGTFSEWSSEADTQGYGKL